MRILHVIDNLGMGGAERVLLTLVREQLQLGLEVKLCSLRSNNAFPERLDGLAAVEFLGFSGSLRDVRGMWRTIRRLRRTIVDYAPDVVHTHLWPPARLAAVAMRGLEPELLVHIHDTRPWLAGSSCRDRMMRRFTRLAFRVRGPRFVAVSEACRKYTLDNLAWLRGEAVPVVPNAFDCRDFDVSTASMDRSTHAVGSAGYTRLVIGTAGRLSEEKGHEHLIRAVGLLRDRGVHVSLRIAGSGSLGLNYAQVIESLNLSDQVELVGNVADMQAFYEQLDVYCQPSTGAEGMPIVILEAMAMGLPIISTAIAGAPEVIRHGLDGLLMPPGDPTAISEAIERLAVDASFRQALGTSARQRALDEFSGRRMAERVLGVYRGLAANEDNRVNRG